MHTGTDGRFVRLGHPGCQLSAPAVKLQTAHDTESRLIAQTTISV